MRTSTFIAMLCYLLPAAAGAQAMADGPLRPEAGTPVVPVWTGGHLVPLAGHLPGFAAHPVGVMVPAAATSGAIHSPELERQLEAARATRSHWRTGAVAGFVIGGGVTFLVLRSGESTAPCDRKRNQDAIGAKECAGIALAGGLVGAGVGALIGGRFRSYR
jgi:hypothetical protein